MRRRTLFVIGVLSLAAFTGCRPASERTAEEMAEAALREGGATDADVDYSEGRVSVSATDEGGRTTIRVAGEGSIDLPAGFTDDVPVFPGTRVVASASAEGEGMSATLATREPGASVHDWYVEELKKKGWEIDQDMKVPPMFIVHGVKGERELSVSVTVEGDESFITIVIIDG